MPEVQVLPTRSAKTSGVRGGSSRSSLSFTHQTPENTKKVEKTEISAGTRRPIRTFAGWCEAAV